jgi:hypothetical protein
VNVNANGTGVAESLTTGVVESVPLRRTRKTTMWLSLAFVVPISFRPSGVKPTWPGDVRKFGGFPFASPSDRAEPAIGAGDGRGSRSPARSRCRRS